MKKGMPDGFALPHKGVRRPALMVFDMPEVKSGAALNHGADSVSVGCFDIGRGGVILQANSAGAKLLGGKHGELIGRQLGAFVADKDQAGFKAFIERAFAGKMQASCGLTLVGQAGDASRDVYCMASADHMRSSCSITVMDQASFMPDPEVQQRETMFWGILETMRDLYYRTDLDGYVEMVSPSCMSLTGYTPEEVVGRRVSEFYADPDQRAVFLALLQQKGHVDDFELNLVHKNGSVRIASASCRLIRDHANRPVGVEGILRDITERKQAEEEIARSRARLAAAQRIACLGDCEFDLATNALTWSDETCRIFEIDSRNFGAKYNSFLAMVHPDDCGWVDDAYAESIRHRKPIDIEHRLLFDDGRVKYVSTRGEIVCDEAGRPSKLHCTVQDITERKRMEMDILEYQNRQDELLHEQIAAQTAAAIAHDLNQPLLAISAYSEVALRMLEDEIPDQQKLASTLQASARQAIRAGDAIRDMLAFLSKREVRVETIDLAQKVRYALEALKREQKIAIRTRVTLPDDMPAVSANKLQVQKVLSNLMQNAVDAMGKAGTPQPILAIDAHFVQDGEMVEVIIRDNGPGFEGSAEVVFEPFFSTKLYGLGMGLTVSRAMIEAQGGRLWADSSPEGGAAFHFTLPVVR